jgi:hypothetical protein
MERRRPASPDAWNQLRPQNVNLQVWMKMPKMWRNGSFDPNAGGQILGDVKYLGRCYGYDSVTKRRTASTRTELDGERLVAKDVPTCWLA